MSEKPFWEGKTLMEIQNLDKRVKVTMENGDVFIGKLVRRSRDADGMCSLSMQLDAHRTYLHVFSAESFDTQPVIPSYVDTVELLDDPEYERIDDIHDVCKGDIFVATNGNRFSVAAVDDDDKTDSTLAVIIQAENTNYHTWMFNSNFAYALRPKPKLPDKPGLWFDKYDAVWCFDGDSLRPLRGAITGEWDIYKDTWWISATTSFAPFRPAKVVEDA